MFVLLSLIALILCIYFSYSILFFSFFYSNNVLFVFDTLDFVVVLLDFDVPGQSSVGRMVGFEEEAYTIYNDHAYKWYSMSKNSKKSVSLAFKSSTWNSLNVINKEKSLKKGKMNRCNSKVDIRTGCKVMIQYELKTEGCWLVITHEISHKH